MFVNRELRPTALFEVLNEFPMSGDFHYIPSGGRSGGRDGIIVSFENGYHRWTGVFAFGQNGSNCPRAVCALPDTGQVLVVSDGDGFIVNETAPGAFSCVHAIPVRHVLVVPSKSLVVLADDTSMVAYGRGGIIWQTERIGWSDFRIERLTDGAIHCSTFDIRNDQDIHFTIDLDTGKCLGGIEVI